MDNLLTTNAHLAAGAAQQTARLPRDTRLFPLPELLAALPKTEKACVIAIDGRSASGKTTLASSLAELLGAGVVHMDDFFLPVELRTPSRLNAPGGNAHYERFKQEILPFLAIREAFSYNVFDCSAMALCGKREVKKSHYRIVEGAYCCHPTLGDYMDVRVFSDIASEEQMERIRLRNGDEAAKAFASRWIPMEEAYFAAFGIKAKADLVIEACYTLEP